MLDSQLDDFLDKIAKDFSSYTYFTVSCPGLDAAKQFATSLPFATVEPRGIKFPNHVRVMIVHGLEEGIALAVIGGDLSVEEICEVLRLAKNIHYKVEKEAFADQAKERLSVAVTLIHQERHGGGFLSRIGSIMDKLFKKGAGTEKNVKANDGQNEKTHASPSTGFFFFNSDKISEELDISSYGAYAQEKLVNALQVAFEVEQMPSSMPACHGDLFEETMFGKKPQALFGDWLSSDMLKNNLLDQKMSQAFTSGESLSFIPYAIAINDTSESVLLAADKYLGESEVVGYLGLTTFESSISLVTILRDFALVKILLEITEDPQRAANYELIDGASEGDSKAVIKAIENGADLNCIDSRYFRSTPMIHAVSGGYTDVVRILLSHGADPESDNKSNSALILAARFGHVEIVKFLLDAGADPYRIMGGGTALDNAKQEEIAQMLREARR